MTRSELSIVALAIAFVAMSPSPGEAARNLEIQVGQSGGMVIAGANVCLGLEQNSDDEGFATTDARGIARFENVPTGSRTYYVSVTAPGLAGASKVFDVENNQSGMLDPPQTVMVSLPGNGAECQGPADPPPPPPPSSSTFRATPSIGVDVLVQTYDGVPLTGVQVCAGLGPGPDSGLFGRVTTDATGRARLNGLPAGGTGRSQIVLTASKVCPMGQGPRTTVNGVPVYDCGVGATWVNPRVAPPSPIAFQVGAADQRSADETAAAADDNCGAPPPSRYPTSWRVHSASPVVPLNGTSSPSVRFDQHPGAEPFYDFVWTVSDASVLELTESNPNDRSATVRGRRLGTSGLTVQLLTQLNGQPQSSAVGGTSTVTVGQAPGPTPTPAPGGAAATFLQVADVFYHPRCVNCHVEGNTPKQRDARDLHLPDGRGIRPQRGDNCTRCHSSSPTTTGYDAPVAPVVGTMQPWSMPPASMAFEDSSRMGGLRLPGDICRTIKQNAGSAQAVVDHLTTDDLVLWAFAPDNGLTPAFPQGHASFLQKMQQWVQQGGDCPP